MNNIEYVRMSLELHLFFDRILKEHSLFLEASFTQKDTRFKQIARDFQKSFESILNRTITLADGNVSNDFLISGEIFTKDTLEAENKTSIASGIPINENITLKELNLKSGNVNTSEDMIINISMLNKQTLPLIENLISFKNDVLNKVLSCKMYTTNYPLLITHIMNEAKMYHTLLSKLESKTSFTRNELYEHELFWNNIMKEHALFIRGLLDPSEEDLILTADKFANEYKKIVKNYSTDASYLTDASLNETKSFKEFKSVGLDGILNCKIKSIIVPLLADHVLREANHFIRILKIFQSSL